MGKRRPREAGGRYRAKVCCEFRGGDLDVPLLKAVVVVKFGYRRSCRLRCGPIVPPRNNATGVKLIS